jgi:hypothetical protein
MFNNNIQYPKSEGTSTTTCVESKVKSSILTFRQLYKRTEKNDLIIKASHTQRKV